MGAEHDGPDYDRPDYNQQSHEWYSDTVRGELRLWSPNERLRIAVRSDHLLIEIVERFGIRREHQHRVPMSEIRAAGYIWRSAWGTLQVQRAGVFGGRFIVCRFQFYKRRIVTWSAVEPKLGVRVIVGLPDRWAYDEVLPEPWVILSGGDPLKDHCWDQQVPGRFFLTPVPREDLQFSIKLRRALSSVSGVEPEQLHHTSTKPPVPSLGCLSAVLLLIGLLMFGFARLNPPMAQELIANWCALPAILVALAGIVASWALRGSKSKN